MTAVQGNGVGFPDVLLIKGNRLVVAELKRSPSEKPTHDQTLWLEAFRGVTEEVFLWSPADWETIKVTLMG